MIYVSSVNKQTKIAQLPNTDPNAVISLLDILHMGR